MININGKQVLSMSINGKMVQMIYRNGQLIWQAIMSCFGSGMWLNDRKWANHDGWKN